MKDPILSTSLGQVTSAEDVVAQLNQVFDLMKPHVKRLRWISERGPLTDEDHRLCRVACKLMGELAALRGGPNSIGVVNADDH